MIEKLYLCFVLLFFILAFAIKNFKMYLSVKQSIKGKSKKLTISILLSTLIYILILLRITILKSGWFLELNEIKIIKITGFVLITFGFVMGILSLVAMKESWRVGIKYDQKTKLVISGIYRVSRNPYFLSYNLLILGYIFVYPSLILLVLYLTLIFVFHLMILEEEKYLESVHGNSYLVYKNKVKRYLWLF